MLLSNQRMASAVELMASTKLTVPLPLNQAKWECTGCDCQGMCDVIVRNYGILQTAFPLFRTQCNNKSICKCVNAMCLQKQIMLGNKLTIRILEQEGFADKLNN